MPPQTNRAAAVSMFISQPSRNWPVSRAEQAADCHAHIPAAPCPPSTLGSQIAWCSCSGPHCCIYSMSSHRALPDSEAVARASAASLTSWHEAPPRHPELDLTLVHLATHFVRKAQATLTPDICLCSDRDLPDPRAVPSAPPARACTGAGPQGPLGAAVPPEEPPAGPRASQQLPRSCEGPACLCCGHPP